MPDYQTIQNDINKFSHDRDWNQFHSPKNLCMALSVEVAELQEHFQWLTQEQSDNLSPERKVEVSEEIADTFVYLSRLADRLGIDLLSAVERKMKINAIKYPIDKAKGVATKYDQFEE
jgi:dCTP diphosphatase